MSSVHSFFHLFKDALDSLRWSRLKRSLYVRNLERFQSHDLYTEYAENGKKHYAARVPCNCAERFSVLYPDVVDEELQQFLLTQDGVVNFELGAPSLQGGSSQAFILAWNRKAKDLIAQAEFAKEIAPVLRELPHQSVQVNVGDGWVHAIYRTDDELHLSRSRATVERTLLRLSNVIQNIRREPGSIWVEIYRMSFFRNLLLGMLLVVTQPPYSFVDSDSDRVLLVAVPMAVITLAYMSYVVRTRGVPERSRHGFKVLIQLSLFSILYLSIALWGNAAADFSQPVIKQLQISAIEPLPPKAKSPSRFRLKLTLPGEEYLDLVEVPAEVVREAQLKVGDEVIAEVHAGAFGVRWISGLDAQSPQGARVKLFTGRYVLGIL